MLFKSFYHILVSKHGAATSTLTNDGTHLRRSHQDLSQLRDAPYSAKGVTSDRGFMLETALNKTSNKISNFFQTSLRDADVLVCRNFLCELTLWKTQTIVKCTDLHGGRCSNRMKCTAVTFTV